MFMKHKKQIILTAMLLLAMAALFFESSVWAKPKITLNRSSLSITAGESRKLKRTGISNRNQSKVSWKSSVPGIASVTKNGKVKAKKAGTTTITANYKEKNYRCKVRVASGKAEGPDIQTTPDQKKEPVSSADTVGNEIHDTQAVTLGTSSYRNFLVDNVYHSKNDGDIHYHVYFPDSYDGKSDYALFITLPGYQGLYFQGVAENIRTEDFAFEAQKYHSKMVILASQLNDWGQTSADQTIALVEYFLEQYRIDPSKVYIEGYSGGGETLSLVLGKKPELFAAALMCSSQWDGAYEPVVRARTPVYFVIGESDEYYGSQPFKDAYQKLRRLYRQQGISETEIEKLLVLDVKDASYFAGTGVTYQHGGGCLFCRDEEIMGWLFR